ncbi:MAG: hypothetical protein DRP27_06725 [Thermotogae bacterium]|nr:MAG: hypothetical protein DRP27_06725 [Thermotogota bacterium]
MQYRFAKQIFQIVKDLNISSVNDLLEGRNVVQKIDEFQKWHSYEFWKEIIGPLLGHPNLLWFDIVLVNPLNGKYIFRAVYYKDRLRSDVAKFINIQSKAQENYYRQRVTSLSSFFVEGIVSPESRCPLWVTKCDSSSIVAKVWPPFLQIGLINVNSVSVVSVLEWEKSANNILTMRQFQEILRVMESHLRLEGRIEPLYLAEYFVWLLSLPRWKHYVYVPLPGFSRLSSALVFVFGREIDENEVKQQILDCYNNKFGALSDVISGMAEDVVLSHAFRSAVAAIMSRNMSHIHGSHIEPGLQTKLHTLREMLI